jgi:hypothetical protein
MERVAFLIEETGERVACMLNPESVVLRRTSGVRVRESVGGIVAGTDLLDDPLLLTGGGSTELLLNLLFDVSVGGSTVQTRDVRDLTGPLWQLAENAQRDGGAGRPPLVRFFWGKSWNVPGIVAAVAERLEHFSAEGAPRRSWLRLRFLRAVPPQGASPGAHPSALGITNDWPQQGAHTPPPDQVTVHALNGAEGPLSGERLDQLAYHYYGSAAHWRLIAAFNSLADPFSPLPGAALEIPPLTCGGGAP